MALTKIERIMMVRAGLDTALVSLGKPDLAFDEVLDGLRTIHRGKEVLYGSYLETHGDDPIMFALMEHFADLKRKYVRADQYMKKTLAGQEIDIMQLFDTYSDMAVYAAMGTQLVLHLIEREARESTPSDDRTAEPEPEGDGASDPFDPNQRGHVVPGDSGADDADRLPGNTYEGKPWF